MTDLLDATPTPTPTPNTTTSDSPVTVMTKVPPEEEEEESHFIKVDTTPSAAGGATNTSNNNAVVVPDVTLLRGLELALSFEEQSLVTSLLTSGNPDDLAIAARVFYNVGVMLKAGVVSPNQRNEYQKVQLEESFSTTFVIGNTSKNTKNTSRPGFNDREVRVATEKKIQQVMDKEKAQGALPLPVRMPRMIVLSASFDATSDSDKKNKLKPLTFVDDPWDGTLGAAFTKLQVHTDAKFVKKLLPSAKQKAGSHVDHDLQFSPGFDAIVDSIEGGYSAPLIQDGLAGDTKQPRVLIATVAKEAAKLGLVQRGDVVTHVNGQAFTGTAHDLNELITKHYHENMNDDNNNNNNSRPLEIVVNAELCIAKALQLRANLMMG